MYQLAARVDAYQFAWPEWEVFNSFSLQETMPQRQHFLKPTIRLFGHYIIFEILTFKMRAIINNCNSCSVFCEFFPRYYKVRVPLAKAN